MTHARVSTAAVCLAIAVGMSSATAQAGIGVGVGVGENDERMRLPAGVKRANDVMSTNSTMRTIKIVPKITRFTIIPSPFGKNLFDAHTILAAKTKRLRKTEDGA